MRKIANETQIGQLIINMKVKTEALERGFETAKKKIQEIEQQNEQLKSSNSGVDASFIAMSASIVGSLYKVISVIKECTEEYNSHVQAVSSLSDVADYTGNSLYNMSKLMNKYSKYMTKSDLAATIKNFSLMNMTMDQTDQMLQSLINSAIKNRNANYDVSTAVKVASDGYKQGLSTLSDSAGVTENLSVMLDNYAKSIGKTASQLTELEQNQAYVTRTMEASAPFNGAMAEYLDTLAGKQGEYSQSLRETKIAYTEAMEPVLAKFTEFKTMMLSGLGQIISDNKSAAVGVTTFIVTLGTFSIAISVVKKAYDMYTNSVLKATIAEKGLGAAIKANPIGLAVTVLSTVVAALTAYTAATKEQQAAEAELLELQKKHNEVIEGTIKLNEENTLSMKNTRDELQTYIDDIQKMNFNESTLYALSNSKKTGLISSEEYAKEVEKIINENKVLSAEVQELSSKFKGMFNISDEDITGIANVTTRINDSNKALQHQSRSQQLLGVSIDDVSGFLKIYNERIDEATSRQKIKTAMDVDSIKSQQKEAAQLKITANQMQSYLNTIKSGNKNTTDYQNAEKELAKAYSEASTAAGINVDMAQQLIDIDQARADQAWNTSQTTIQGNIETIQSFIQQAEAAKNNIGMQKELAETIGIEYSAIIPTLNTVLSILQLIGGYETTEVPNITPTSVSSPKTSSGGSSSYSNKALENYKKEIEHKKAMDQISLKEEISMYEYALRVYAKTADERMELREKIYALNKELAQKEKEILDQQTEDYEAYIQQQINSRGAEYNINERNRDYNKIIQMHKNYLNQIMYDERLSLDERKEIYREELQTIRDYEQQKRDLRVEQIDNTVSQLTNAITKQLEEMQEKEKSIIDENLKVIEEWKNARIKAINDEYDARIEAINKELEALNKAEQQKTRDEEDAEYEKKKKRLEDLIAFEHDATTKANYQKELDKLVAEYQKTLDKRALEDKKEALNQQKELLQEEQDNKVQSVENEAKRQTEIYENQLTELEKYYDEQIDMAQKTAENMLLNVGKNQDKILELLKNYGDAYEITGQSLGEKLAQGINEGIAGKIENIIAKIQNTIDANIEAQIAKMTSSAYQYEAGANKPQTTSISITQQNYIEQNPEMPSETYRKLNNVSENLAAQLRAEID